MERRALLQSAATAGGLLLAGCLSDDPEGPVASPALIEIANNTGEPVTVQVITQKDGTEVHNEAYQLEPVRTGEASDTEEYGVIDGVEIVEEWMADPAEYEFQFSVPDHDLSASFSSADPIGAHDNAHHSELEGECYFVRAAVGDEDDPLTARLDAVPAQLVAWAIVYDHDVFDREHAGDCT